jgi:hypothetical protein
MHRLTGPRLKAALDAAGVRYQSSAILGADREVDPEWTVLTGPGGDRVRLDELNSADFALAQGVVDAFDFSDAATEAWVAAELLPDQTDLAAAAAEALADLETAITSCNGYEAATPLDNSTGEVRTHVRALNLIVLGLCRQNKKIINVLAEHLGL